jgi:hypothetical protein
LWQISLLVRISAVSNVVGTFLGKMHSSFNFLNLNDVQIVS